MSIVHVVGKGGSIPIDRTLFFGTSVPNDIVKSLKYLTKGLVDKTTFRKILQVILKDLEGSEVEYSAFKELQSKAVNEETLCIIYAGIYKLIKLALRIPETSLKPELFKEDLHELKIPNEFIPDITSLIFGSKRPALDQAALNRAPRLPKLEQFQWRVDVGISTSVLNRALEPTLLVEMTLSDGNVHQFEVPVSKFHELRYTVASVLKEMEDLEKRNILRIQD